METKKETAKKKNYINSYTKNVLYYFNQMFEIGGTYQETASRDKKYFKYIEIKLNNNMIIKFPVTKEEYTAWREIKPKLQEAEK